MDGTGEEHHRTEDPTYMKMMTYTSFSFAFFSSRLSSTTIEKEIKEKGHAFFVIGWRY
jgi:hypothetical protein